MQLYIFCSTGIDSLRTILPTIHELVNWKQLGLELGLLHATLQKIDIQQRSAVDDCKLEMISAWLNWTDDVKSCGMPSWQRLLDALVTVGEDAVINQMMKSLPWKEDND